MTSADVVNERRKLYTGAFKADAVERVLRTGATSEDVRAVAAELGIPEPTLLIWIEFARQGLAAADTDERAGDDMVKEKIKKPRTPYDQATREKAVAAYNAGGKTLQDVGEAMGIDKSTISAWVRKDAEDSQRPGNGPAEQAEQPAAKDMPPAGLALGIGSSRGGGRDPADRMRAAEEVIDRGRTVQQVAVKYKVAAGSVYAWVRQLKDSREQGAPAAKPAPQPRQAALEQMFESPKKRAAAKPRASTTQTALAFPAGQINGHARGQVLPLRESASMAAVIARNAVLEQQNKKLRRMLSMFLDDDTIDGGHV